MLLGLFAANLFSTGEDPLLCWEVLCQSAPEDRETGLDLEFEARKFPRFGNSSGQVQEEVSVACVLSECFSMKAATAKSII